MILYFLEPEVSGGHGEQTIYGTDENIAREGVSGKIKFLHYEFEGWLGDDLLESTPAFIISSYLENELRKSNIKDFKAENCLITMSDNFIEHSPTIEIPAFTRFIPLGTVELEGKKFKNWSGHHFCLTVKGELIVTQQALNFLEKFSISHCDITSLSQK